VEQLSDQCGVEPSRTGPGTAADWPAPAAGESAPEDRRSEQEVRAVGTARGAAAACPEPAARGERAGVPAVQAETKPAEPARGAAVTPSELRPQEAFGQRLSERRWSGAPA